jgi:hypothetical protein
MIPFPFFEIENFIQFKGKENSAITNDSHKDYQ